MVKVNRMKPFARHHSCFIIQQEKSTASWSKNASAHTHVNTHAQTDGQVENILPLSTYRMGHEGIETH